MLKKKKLIFLAKFQKTGIEIKHAFSPIGYKNFRPLHLEKKHSPKEIAPHPDLNFVTYLTYG